MFSFVAKNTQTVSIVIITIIFLISIIFLWRERRKFLALFKKNNNVIFLGLLAIVIAFSLLCIFKGFNFKSFIPSDQEWEILEQAKDLTTGEQILRHSRYGLVYPLFLSFLFKIFGFNLLTASIMNFILAILSIFLVFALSQAIFKKEKISLITTFFYTFTPLVFVFSSFQMGHPTIISFFLLLTSLVCVLYFQHHTINLLILSISLISLIGQIKPEYFALILPFTFCFLLFKEYKKVSFKKIIIVFFLFLIFSSPYFIQNFHFKESFSLGWCGAPSQAFYEGEECFYDTPIANKIDPILQFFTNKRFSMNYLIYDLPNFFAFWTLSSFNIIPIFALMGLVFGYKKYWKEFSFLSLVFFLINTTYLIDCAFFESRYVIPTYGILIIFAGFGFCVTLKNITRLISKNSKFLDVLLLIIIFLIAKDWWTNHYQAYLFEETYYDHLVTRGITNSYEKITKALENIPTNNANFIVVHNNEERILKFLGYQAFSLVNLETLSGQKAPTREFNLEGVILPLEATKNNYFIHSWYCDTLPSLQESCNFVKDNYSLELVKYISKKEQVYLFADF